MTKKRIALEDGRYLVYFSFEGRKPAAEGAERAEPSRKARRTGVRRGRS